MNVRTYQNSDKTTVLDIIENAFSEEENLAVKNFVAELLEEETEPCVLSLVAESDNDIFGFISFSPIYVTDASDISGYILSPVAVSPSHQSKGIGSKLINEGKRILAEQKIDAVLVYGDPAYYGKFGFSEEIGRQFIPPYTIAYPFGWQGLILNDQSDITDKLNFTCVASLNKPDLW